MKIMILGSMSFAQQILATQQELEKLGHQVFVQPDIHACLEDPTLNTNLAYCLATDIHKQCFDLLSKSDAVLVLNYPRKNISGYIGGGTLMEIGLAKYLDKKIFLLFDPPSEEELSYALEIKATRPIILQGDLRRISQVSRQRSVQTYNPNRNQAHKQHFINRHNSNSP